MSPEHKITSRKIYNVMNRWQNAADMKTIDFTNQWML